MKKEEKNITLIAIAAACRTPGNKDKYGIGMKGTIPWKNKHEMKHFQEATRGHAVIMGRNTCDSLKNPLKDRRNIVLSHDMTFAREGFTVVHSVDEAFDVLEAGETAFVIGGEAIYRLFEEYYDGYIVSVIEDEYDCDSFLPPSIAKGYEYGTDLDGHHFHSDVMGEGYEDIDPCLGFYVWMNLSEDAYKHKIVSKSTVYKHFLWIIRNQYLALMDKLSWEEVKYEYKLENNDCPRGEKNKFAEKFITDNFPMIYDFLRDNGWLPTTLKESMEQFGSNNEWNESPFFYTDNGITFLLTRQDGVKFKLGVNAIPGMSNESKNKNDWQIEVSTINSDGANCTISRQVSPTGLYSLLGTAMAFIAKKR